MAIIFWHAPIRRGACLYDGNLWLMIWWFGANGEMSNLFVLLGTRKFDSSGWKREFIQKISSQKLPWKSDVCWIERFIIRWKNGNCLIARSRPSSKAVDNAEKHSYFRKDSGLEVDFVMRYKGKSTLVEVKTSNGNTKSTRTILAPPEKYRVSQAIKLGDCNVGCNEQLLTLPLYMAFMLKEY